MAKSTNNQRLYLDFNATSPLAPPVKEYLAQGDFLFGNPASLHTAGKRSKRAIGEVRDYLYRTLGLAEDDYDLFFHSGATEAINGLVKSLALGHDDFHFMALASDHSCVFEQREFLLARGQRFSTIEVDENGAPLFASANPLPSFTLVNLTLANNETGVVLGPEQIEAARKHYPQALIHLDAVQGPGKVKDLASYARAVDALTFSAHKFGAQKGVGLTFIHKKVNYQSLIVGGDQQNSLRAGTENPDGVWSVKLALEWTLAQDQERLRRTRDRLEEEMIKLMGDQVVIAGRGARERSANTSYFIVRGVKADILLTAFDLAGMDVSSGSACRSGSVSPSRVLLAMGHDEADSRGAIRLSLGHHLSDEELEQLPKRVLTVLSRFKREG